MEDSLMETKPTFQSDFYDEADNIHHSFHGPRKAWKKPSRSPTPVYSSIMFKGFFMCVDCTTTSYLLINSLWHMFHSLHRPSSLLVLILNKLFIDTWQQDVHACLNFHSWTTTPIVPSSLWTPRDKVLIDVFVELNKEKWGGARFSLST